MVVKDGLRSGGPTCGHVEALSQCSAGVWIILCSCVRSQWVEVVDMLAMMLSNDPAGCCTMSCLCIDLVVKSHTDMRCFVKKSP